MEIQELWRVMTQRWRVVLTTMLVAISLALAWALAGPVRYTATGDIVISTYGSLGTANDAFAGEQVSQQRAPTYAQLLRGPEIAARASALLNGEISAQTIDDAVDARIVSRLPLVTVTATMPKANDAARVVGAVEQAFQQYVNEIERPGRDGSLTAVRLSGDPPAVTRDGNPTRDALLAALFGFILGTALAVYRDRTDPVVRSPGQVAEIGLRHLATMEVPPQESSPADPFRRLAAECLQVGPRPENAESVILVVGCELGEEASSLVAAGLAGGLVACGRPTTLVNTSPLNTSSGEETSRDGLSDVLDGSASWSDCLVDGSAGVAVMGPGARGEALDQILLSANSPRHLPKPSNPDEGVVIDAPSIVHSSTAVALTTLANSALIVAIRGRTKVEHLLEAKLTLEALDTPIAGLVLATPVKARRSSKRSSDSGDAPARATEPVASGHSSAPDGL